ncbi:hypothetical protein Dimus_039226 [Dionaea muscipula]
MARGAPICIFFLFLLSSLSVCTYGTEVGFYYDARRSTGTSSSSIIRSMSLLRLSKVHPFQIRVLVSDPSALLGLVSTGVSVDVYLDQAHLEGLRNSSVFRASWLKTHMIRSLSSGMKINSIIIRSWFSDSQLLLSTLKSISSLMTSMRLENPLKLSVALPLSLLQNLRVKSEKDLNRIFKFLERRRSFITVEAHIDGEEVSSLEDDGLLRLIRNKASLAALLLSHTDLPILLTIKSSSAVPTLLQLADLGDKILRSLEEDDTRVMAKICGLLLEMPEAEQQKKKERQLVDVLKPETTTSHDIFNPSTPPVTSPSTTSADCPPYNPSPTPTIVIIPGTNPATNPAATPVTVTPTNPFSSPAPVLTYPPAPPLTTNPGAQPVTNPVTTFPSPVGYVPVPNPPPVTTMPTPVTSAPPIIPGQTWCIARSGVLDSALQTALDYACGIGGADCSMIQPGGSCYNPNTVENHASYAFNIYFQKNPVPSSCDFGGTAMLINTNPSSGTCIYPLLGTASPLATVPPATTIPPPATMIPPATTSVSGIPGSSSGTQSSPSVLGATNPTSASSAIYGSESPPALNSTASGSIRPQPLIDCMILIGMFTLRTLYLL